MSLAIYFWRNTRKRSLRQRQGICCIELAFYASKSRLSLDFNEIAVYVRYVKEYCFAYNGVISR